MLLQPSLLPFRFQSDPGPQTTRPSCHFLGLSENASSFSEQRKKKKKTSARFPVFSFLFWITYPELKTKRHVEEGGMSSTDHSRFCFFFFLFPPPLLSATPPVDGVKAAPECEDPLQPRPVGRSFLRVGDSRRRRRKVSGWLGFSVLSRRLHDEGAVV